VTRAGIRATKVNTHATPVHRSLDEVFERLDDASPVVPPEVLATARRVFSRINTAETEVHGAHVHFHEVGADDAIADVIGACTALATLQVDGVAVLPLALGSGTATGSHGTIPIPAPATVAILKGSGLATMQGSDAGELCTPTGAALLAEFSSVVAADLGGYTIQAVGYGAGSRDTPHSPNVIRAMVVETTGALPQDTVDLLETNMDDVSGEVIGEALARFIAAGARDASATPIVMKKGRPGYLVTVIALPETSAALARLMARELGTLGVRCIPVVHRFVAERTIADVEVEIAGHKKLLPVKCGWMDGRIYTLKAEFDTARDWAAELDLPVRDVLRAIEAAAWNQVREKRQDASPGVP
jgi:uncharacterized protein (TIGR00299 family) protein